MYRITCVVGTRPEAIKMAPLILTLKKDKRFAVTVLATGQHTEMLHQALSHFGIAADVDLNIMRDRQTLDHITSAVLTGVGGFLDESRICCWSTGTPPRRWPRPWRASTAISPWGTSRRG